MKVAELILEYLKVLAYPVAWLVVFFALKDHIRDLLVGIRYLLDGKIVAKYGDVSFEIGGEHSAADQNAILDYIKESGGSLSLNNLYSEAVKRLGKSISPGKLKREIKRIDSAIAALAQKGVIVKDNEDVSVAS